MGPALSAAHGKRHIKRLSSIFLFAPLAAVLVTCDRASKSWAQDALAGTLAGSLSPADAIDLSLLPIRLTLVHNTGAAFGLGEGSTGVFIAIAAVIVCVIAAWLLALPRHTPPEVVSLALVCAGGIGNLIDRIALGYVVDFIEFTFIDFPVFNVADICVTCGVALFIVCVLFFMATPGADASATREDAAYEDSAYEDSSYGDSTYEDSSYADSSYEDSSYATSSRDADASHPYSAPDDLSRS